MMGSGKSSVGRKLSSLLSLPFIDLDEYIEERQGCSVGEIFARKGEAAFRAMERQALDEILGGSPAETGRKGNMGGGLVLSLGGGTLTSAENAEKIAEKTLCIYLKATADTLAGRLGSEAQGRPMLAGKNLHSRVAELLEEREPRYERAARRTIATDGLSVEEIAGRIAGLVRDSETLSEREFESV